MAEFGKLKFVLLGFVLLLPLWSTGCAEGIFWRGGQYVPWAQNQWAEEEKIADTLFSRKRKLDLLVSSAENQPVDRQTQAAEELLRIVKSRSGASDTFARGQAPGSAQLPPFDRGSAGGIK